MPNWFLNACKLVEFAGYYRKGGSAWLCAVKKRLGMHWGADNTLESCVVVVISTVFQRPGNLLAHGT